MKTELLSDHKKNIDSDKIRIVEFFLTFFMVQKGVSTESRSKYVLIDNQKSDPKSDQIYELKYRHSGKWHSRRMSIAPLGEKSGSKSTCFKVIYDNLMVVKIPPFPIKHFDEYVKNVETERRIVDALTPDIDCISPRVSTILKKVAPFSRDAEMDPEKFEQKCIQRLRSFPQFQRHLRIGDSFAFFMDLSKHLFLSQVIRKIHDIEDKMEKEIISQSDSLWDLMVFEDIYGTNTAPVFYSMNDVYLDYDNRLDTMLQQYEMERSVPMYEKKEWFLRHLARKPLTALARMQNTIIVTFGDLLRVPGTTSSLQVERAQGRDIRVVYSATDALNIARDNSGRNIIFLGVGFETTAPTIAASLLMARQMNLDNYYVFSAHKVVPPALEALMQLDGVRVDGFILPGHVSVIIGSSAYQSFFARFQTPCAIAGFEPVDLLQAIAILVGQLETGYPELVNAYSRAVAPQGNPKAKDIMKKVFKRVDATWRGIGSIPQSGLKINEAFASFDAERYFEIPMADSHEPTGCICGQILTGKKNPPQCPLFRKRCTPASPVGACMVSSEGTCAAYYRYAD